MWMAMDSIKAFTTSNSSSNNNSSNSNSSSSSNLLRALLLQIRERLEAAALASDARSRPLEHPVNPKP